MLRHDICSPPVLLDSSRAAVLKEGIISIMIGILLSENEYLGVQIAFSVALKCFAKYGKQIVRPWFPADFTKDDSRAEILKMNIVPTLARMLQSTEPFISLYEGLRSVKASTSSMLASQYILGRLAHEIT